MTQPQPQLQPQKQEEANSNTKDQPVFIDTQHDDMIHDAQLDYYGCKLATCSSDRTIKIFHVSSSDAYTHTATLQNHECGPIWSLAWSHPKFGSVLSSCGFDGSILIHRERTAGDWVLVASHRNLHESSVNSVSFCPHEYGLILAGASSDGSVSVLTHLEDDTWDISKIRDNALGVNSVSWSPYEEQYMKLVTGGCDNQVRFWRKKVSVDDDGNHEWEIDPDAVCGGELCHTDWVRDVAWSPVRIGGNETVGSCSEDGTVIIWTKTKGETSWLPKLLHCFDAPVWRLSWSLTGNILAVSSGDGDVTLWKQGLDCVWRKVSTVEDSSEPAVSSQ